MNITIELAGVKADIDCRFPETRDFFREYLCDGPGTIQIRPGEEDCRRMEVRQRKQAARDGMPDAVFHDWFLERSAIHGLLAEALIEEQVLLVHGSAIVLDGEAYVFMADSGTGKSTHTRLWREHFGERAWMLNDDKPMLKLTENGAVVYGTPWDGKHHLSRNACAPLRAIVQLTRSEENHVEPLEQTEALMMLLHHCVRSERPEKMKQIMQLGLALIQQAGTFRLGCNMEPEAAAAAYQGITGRMD